MHTQHNAPRRNRLPSAANTLALTAMCAVMSATAGCASAARVQLSAAQSLDALTDAVQSAVDELHNEVRAADRSRRVGAVDAFIARIRADHADQLRAAQHADAFHQSLDRLRDDADVEFARHLATVENIQAIKEIAGGLREIGIQSISLDDELRRYITDVFEKPKPDLTDQRS